MKRQSNVGQTSFFQSVDGAQHKATHCLKELYFMIAPPFSTAPFLTSPSTSVLQEEQSLCEDNKRVFFNHFDLRGHRNVGCIWMGTIIGPVAKFQ